MWRKRGNIKNVQKKLARATEFKVLFESFQCTYPTESHRALRARIREFLMGASMQLAAHFLKCSVQTRERYEAIHRTFMEEATKQADDASYVPTLQGKVLKGEEAGPNARS
jgi:hypothetical protein